MTLNSALRRGALVGILLGSLAVPGRAAESAAPKPSAVPKRETSIPPPFMPRLSTAPLRGARVLNGGFGDFRGGHFHAGFDFGTAQRTGRAVRAPVSGWIERVRSSGVGYGRALYLRARDGRLLEFGHLDAFAPSIASYVDSAKVAKGDYEQDLWPVRGRFSFKAGALMAWSGESGAGGPHLHFEVRRGDVAYHPVRAGLATADTVPPTLTDLTLEPLDDASIVEGNAGPATFDFARRDTLTALGRFRAIASAYDRIAAGGARLAPWRVGVEWDGRRTECRFDSVSWATDMPEADYVYDTGRVNGGKGFVLWAPVGFRPAVLHADAPAGEEAGTIEIRAGDPPRPLRAYAQDLGGGRVSRTLVIRPGPAAAPATAGWSRGEKPWTDESLEVISLPGGFLRLQIPIATAKRDVSFQFADRARRATRGVNAWSVTLAVPSDLLEGSRRLPLAIRSAEGAAPRVDQFGGVWARCAVPSREVSFSDSATSFQVDLRAGTLFEDAALLAYSVSARHPIGLVSVGTAWRLEPTTLPLRRAARVALVMPRAASRERIGLYRLEGTRWQWVGAVVDSVSNMVRGESRRLGTFAVFRDDIAPRIKLRPPPFASAPRSPYSRWAIEAAVADDGSGIDGTKSYLEVDGRRVPTEWDPEAGVLRWRPLHPPSPGAHDVAVVAVDRAGNQSRTEGAVRKGP